MRLPTRPLAPGHALSTMDCVVTGCGWLARPSRAVSMEQISESGDELAGISEDSPDSIAVMLTFSRRDTLISWSSGTSAQMLT